MDVAESKKAKLCNEICDIIAGISKEELFKIIKEYVKSHKVSERIQQFLMDLVIK